MSLHDDALATLRAWSPAAPDRAGGAGDPDRDDQERLRARYVHHLETHPDGLERACFPDHVTAGALVIDETGEHVLLNLHRKAGRWFAFGGHTEPGDATLADVALREAHEESGLRDLRLDPVPLHLDEHAVDFCDPRGTVHHLDVRFGAVAPGSPQPQASAESLAVRWWPVSALPELEDEILVLIDLARARLAP